MSWRDAKHWWCFRQAAGSQAPPTEWQLPMIQVWPAQSNNITLWLLLALLVIAAISAGIAATKSATDSQRGKSWCALAGDFRMYVQLKVFDISISSAGHWGSGMESNENAFIIIVQREGVSEELFSQTCIFLGIQCFVFFWNCIVKPIILQFIYKRNVQPVNEFVAVLSIWSTVRLWLCWPFVSNNGCLWVSDGYF